MTFRRREGTRRARRQHPISGLMPLDPKAIVLIDKDKAERVLAEARKRFGEAIDRVLSRKSVDQRLPREDVVVGEKERAARD